MYEEDLECGVTTAVVRGRQKFSTHFPILQHLVGKLLLDIAGTKEIVERLTVIVTGIGILKLLVVPHIAAGSGKEKAAAGLKIMNNWNIHDKCSIQGLMFGAPT